MRRLRMTKEEARNVLRRAGVSFNANFSTLNLALVSRILEVADEIGYRKPKNASGSRARYFFAYLQSRRGE